MRETVSGSVRQEAQFKLPSGLRVEPAALPSLADSHRKALDLLFRERTSLETPTGEKFSFTFHAPLGIIGTDCFRIQAHRGPRVIGQVDTAVRYEIDPVAKSFSSYAVIDYGFRSCNRDTGERYFVPGQLATAIWVEHDIRARYRGVGTTLIGFAARIAREYSALSLRVSEVMTGAIPFYEKVGFLRHEGTGGTPTHFLLDLAGTPLPPIHIVRRPCAGG